MAAGRALQAGMVGCEKGVPLNQGEARFLNGCAHPNPNPNPSPSPSPSPSPDPSQAAARQREPASAVRMRRTPSSGLEEAAARAAAQGVPLLPPLASPEQKEAHARTRAQAHAEGLQPSPTP